MHIVTGIRDTCDYAVMPTAPLRMIHTTVIRVLERMTVETVIRCHTRVMCNIPMYKLIYPRVFCILRGWPAAHLCIPHLYLARLVIHCSVVNEIIHENYENYSLSYL